MPVPEEALTMAAHYRAKAEECERKAQQASDPDIKLWFEEVAGEWRKLADGSI
jgi:hypothetical protein